MFFNRYTRPTELSARPTALKGKVRFKSPNQGMPWPVTD